MTRFASSAPRDRSRAKTPPKVVLNEAIELAKKFSSEDAAGFVNGVLDGLLKSLQKQKSV